MRSTGRGKVLAATGSGGISQRQRGARGRIHLVAVVGLEDLDVVGHRQRLRGAADDVQQHVERQAGVGRDQHGDLPGGGVDALLRAGVDSPVVPIISATPASAQASAVAPTASAREKSITTSIEGSNAGRSAVTAIPTALPPARIPASWPTAAEPGRAIAAARRGRGIGTRSP